MESAPAPAPLPPGNADTPPAPTPMEQISDLRGGRNPAVAAALADPMDPGHAAARAKMDELHRAAYPEEADAAPTAAEPPQPINDLPLVFAPDLPVEAQLEQIAAANEAITALNLPADLARGGIAMLEAGIAARNATPMNAAELGEFEAALQARWGADYDAKVDAVQAAIAKAGKNGDWLRRSILASGPATAVWAFASLADVQGQ